jgi:amino acid adenylation domain-containing protein
LVLPKSNNAIVAMLGILLAGAAYVPFDLRLPPERLARTLANCDAKVLVATAATIDRIHSIDAALLRNLRAVVTDTPCKLANSLVHEFARKADAYCCSPPASDRDPAYVLYTSGSTGEPKGVVHSHQSAASFVDWAVRTFDLGPKHRLTNLAQLSFDLSVFDIFGSFSSGAAVEIVRPELVLRPKELVRKLNEWQISLLYAVPSTISLLESDGGLRNMQPPSLTRVLYAGEPFSVPRLRRVMQALPQTQFYNLYGPTETNVCTYFAIPMVPDENASHIPIGRPCDHLMVELRDANATETPQGDEGEVCVAGPSVMTEYFRRADATRKVLFEASLFNDKQARYRTGDRAFVDCDGNFWFVGRRDRMVKKRGYRIELGEIEATLNQMPVVQESAAFAISEGEGLQLGAVVVLLEGLQVNTLTLKAHCGRLLPAYMVPDSFLILPDLPRTSNGKVDLKRLGDVFSAGILSDI